MTDIADRSLTLGQTKRPPAGWLRTAREKLGLTLADLATLLGVTPPAVRSFEQAEAQDRITLASLRRSADAMDCELVYALVPRTPTSPEPTEIEEPRKSRRPSIKPRTPPPEPPQTARYTDKVTDLTRHTEFGDA